MAGMLPQPLRDRCAIRRFLPAWPCAPAAGDLRSNSCHVVHRAGCSNAECSRQHLKGLPVWQEEVSKLESTDRPWQAIIFVERRMAAYALWQLLSTCPSLDFLSCQVLMGQGGVLQSATHTFKVSVSKHQHAAFHSFKGGSQSANLCTSGRIALPLVGSDGACSSAGLHGSCLSTLIAFEHHRVAQ